MSRWFEWHWHTFTEGLPVTFPALSVKHFRWTGVYGLQAGPWFIGVVKGEPGAAFDAEADVSCGKVVDRGGAR